MVAHAALQGIHAGAARHRLTTSALASPALVPGERIVCTEADRDGVPVVATDRGIYQRDGGGWTRLGWEQVRRVDWDGRRHALLLWGLTPNVPRSTSVVLSRGSRLVALARERVAWCTVPIPSTVVDGVGMLLAARRQPGTERLVWVVAFNADVDRDDPVTSERLTAALRRLRAAAGV